MPWLEIGLESLHLEGIPDTYVHFRVPAPQCLQDTLQGLATSFGRIRGQRTFKNIALLGGVEQPLLAMKKVIWEMDMPVWNQIFRASIYNRGPRRSSIKSLNNLYTMIGEISNYVHHVSRDSNNIIYNNTVNSRGMNRFILHFNASSILPM